MVLNSALLYHQFEVAGKSVLELGAGLGLPGLTSVLLGAKLSLITEYPDEAIVKMLEQNRRANLNEEEQTRCRVMGHAWGEPVDALIEVNGGNQFDLVFVADCIWMVEQHELLLQTCLRTLNRDGGRIVLTCFPHTGKLNVERFFCLLTDAGMVYEPFKAKIPVEGISFTDSDGEPVSLGRNILDLVQCYVIKFKE